MPVLTVSVTVHGDAVLTRQERTIQIPLTLLALRRSRAAQTLSIDVASPDDVESLVHLVMNANVLSEGTFPDLFPDLDSYNRYTTLKEMATGYANNLRGLEEHWRSVFAELLRTILPRHIIIQEEGTLWTFHDTARNPVAVDTPFSQTLPLSKDSGYGMRPDFRAILRRIKGHIHFPIVGENKKAISRRHTADSGWPSTPHGRAAFVQALHCAVAQVELQVGVLFQLDGASSDRASRQSTACLIAAVGSIYVTALVSRDQMHQVYPTLTLDGAPSRMDALKSQEERDALDMNACDKDITEPLAPNSMLGQFDSYNAQEYAAKLPEDLWSKPCILDTEESNEILRSLCAWPYLNA